jgi:hypothetical protein
VSIISAAFPNADFVFQQDTYVGSFHFTFPLPALFSSLIVNTFMKIQFFWHVPLYHWMSGSRVKQFKIQMMKEIYSFKTSANTHPTTSCHIPQDLNPQQHHCENLNYCKTLTIFTRMQDEISSLNLALKYVKFSSIHVWSAKPDRSEPGYEEQTKPHITKSSSVNKRGNRE